MNKIKYTFYCFAGHWNRDPGAIGPNGEKEADFTKKWRDLISLRVKQLCPEINVVNDDDNDSLSKVIAKTRNSIKSIDLLLEIHLNSATNNKATGTESFIDDNGSARSRNIAAEISSIASKIMGIPDRGVKTESQSHRGQLGIVGMTGAAVLWEAVFINNQSDINAQEKNMHWVADEIARIVIKDYKLQLSKH